jgi:hypothetical protein
MKTKFIALFFYLLAAQPFILRLSAQTSGTAPITYSFNALWNYTQSSGLLPNPDWTFTSTYARDIAADNQYVYIPIRASASGMAMGVRVINQNTGQYIQNLSMNGVSGGTYPICGVATTTDGMVLVSNLTTNVGNSPLKIYMYNSSNLNADPTVLLSFSGTSATNTLSARFGDNFTYSGSSIYGQIMAASSTLPNEYFIWYVENGVVVNNEPTVVNLLNADGSPYTVIKSWVSPRVYNAGGDSVWVKGSAANVRPLLFIQNRYAGTIGSSALINTFGNTALPFTYNGRRYIASIDYVGSTNYTNATGKLIDVTDSVEGALACSTPTNFGTTANSTLCDGVAVSILKNGLKIYFLSATEGTAAYSIGNISTGIREVTNQNNNLFKNPVRGTIQFTQTIRQATIYSLSGNVLMNSSTNCNQMSVSDLADGIYIIKIVAGNGDIFNEKLIVE